MHIERIDQILKEMQVILEQTQASGWASKLEVYRKQLTSNPEDAPRLARELLKVYGGMGSLSDLVLYQDGKLAVELNNRFDSLRSQLHQSLVSTIAAE